MSFLAVGFWLLSVMLLASIFHARRKETRALKLRHAAWDRQRWSIQMFNGRYNLGFGYFKHRMPF